MSLKIESITLERFRAFRELTICGLGRVNLITGKNSAGKSSVLEGLRLLASTAAPDVIYDILRHREENIEEAKEEGHPADPDSLFQVSGLFHGFPLLSENPEPIAISTSGKSSPMSMTIRFSWLPEELDPGGKQQLFPQFESEGRPALIEGRPALIVETKEGTRHVMSKSFDRYYPSTRRSLSEELFGTRMPCIFVSPYGGEDTGMLGPLWDKIALSDREKDVVEGLRIIDPQISAVSIVGGTRRKPTAIVRADNIARPIPLRSFGDGLNRLFGIILSLVNARGGLLLVDEFENGLHHTVQLDVWRTIFRLAQTLDIQVFATSHSWDAVEAFQKAAAEAPEEGVLIRLARMGEDIIPTVLSEDELAIATRDQIEVR